MQSVDMFSVVRSSALGWTHEWNFAAVSHVVLIQRFMSHVNAGWHSVLGWKSGTRSRAEYVDGGFGWQVWSISFKITQIHNPGWLVLDLISLPHLYFCFSILIFSWCRYCIVLFAGIAAEGLVYGEAEGGESDENLYKGIISGLRPPWGPGKVSSFYLCMMFLSAFIFIRYPIQTRLVDIFVFILPVVAKCCGHSWVLRSLSKFCLSLFSTRNLDLNCC